MQPLGHVRPEGLEVGRLQPRAKLGVVDPLDHGRPFHRRPNARCPRPRGEPPHGPIRSSGAVLAVECSVSCCTRRTTRTRGERMQLGMVGLGRMGANIVRRLMRDGHDCVVYDVNPDAVKALESEGATGAGSLSELAEKLSAPRAVWVMVPAGDITEKTVHDVADALDGGDAIIDGGNSYYRDDTRRAADVSDRGIDYIDCGTSGGVFGLDRGYCLMIGG